MSKSFNEHDLDLLYQQRKQQLSVPKVDINKLFNSTKEHPWSIKKIVVIFSLSTMMSFSLFALVQYLIKQTTSNPQVTNSSEVTIIQFEEPMQTTLNTVHVSLPTQPKFVTPPVKEQLTITPNTQARLIEPTPPKVVIQETMLSTINEPSIPLTPVHRVMPKYPLAALKNKIETEVTLSYSINAKGQVINIKPLNSTINKALLRAASKALSEWQFQVPNNLPVDWQQTDNIIEFKFSLSEHSTAN